MTGMILMKTPKRKRRLERSRRRWKDNIKIDLKTGCGLDLSGCL
jgi:hypothetical protein